MTSAQLLVDLTPATNSTMSGELEESESAIESSSYYYGRISRETAEWVLWDRGCSDGLFLVRDSSSDFVLSLCHAKR